MGKEVTIISSGQGSSASYTLVCAGFGALIRSMGMHINKNRNKDASRDLSGRRMRDVEAEKKWAPYL